MHCYHTLVKVLAAVATEGVLVQFGGGKSTGFGLIYDDKEALMRFEPKHRQARIGLLTLKSGSRKQMKERRRRAMKHRGQKKAESVLLLLFFLFPLESQLVALQGLLFFGRQVLLDALQY